MNAVIENILTRRSIRSFKAEKVSRAELELMTKAGQYAPSAMNKQTFQITAVQNADIIKRLYTAIPKYMEGLSDYNFYGANTLLLISDLKGKEIGQMDCACVAENIFLAAHSLGVGTVWINQFRDTSDCPEVRAALHDAGVPDGHRVWVAVAAGYPNETPTKEKTATVKYCD